MSNRRLALGALLFLFVAACTPTPAAVVVDVPSPTVTLTRTPGPTRTPTDTPTATRTPRPTLTPTPTATVTLTFTPGPSPTITLSPTVRVTPTPFSYGPTATPSATFTPAPTEAPQATAGSAATGEATQDAGAGGGSQLPDDPRRALELAADALDRLESLHNEYTLTYAATTPSEGEPVTVTADFVGRVDATFPDPEDADFSLTEDQSVTYPGSGTVSTSSSVIKVGDTYWTRTGDTGNWLQQTVYDTFNADYDPYHRGAFVLRETATAEWLTDAAGHLTYTVNINDFTTLSPFQGRRSLFGPGGAEGVEIRGTITGETWLDPQSLHVLRQTMTVTAEVTVQGQTSQVTINYDVTASQHNAVAPIQPPPADQVQ